MSLTIGSATQNVYPSRMLLRLDAANRDPNAEQTGALSKLQEEQSADKVGKLPSSDDGECQTCKNRKYQDGSDDPGVSYKNPTSIDPGAVAGAVRGHEMEHVYRERFQAESEGRRILYQSVTLHNGICPECGKAYISGGTTRTVSKGDTAQQAQLFRVGLSDESPSGSNLSMSA